MKQAFVIFIMVFIGFVFVTNTSAQTVPLGASTTESKKILLPETQTKLKGERKRLSGTVVVVDAISKTVVVKNWRGETTFDAAGARVARRANLEDLKPGDRIQVSYAEEDGRKTAKVLIATPAKPEGNSKNRTGE